KSTSLPQANFRISEGPTRSRAAGVTIVLGPIRILRFSRMASRTSASHTNSAGFGAGSEGVSCGASQPYPPGGRRWVRKRSTTSAAMPETTEDVTGAAGVQPQDGPLATAAFAAVPLAADTAIPRDARYFSTAEITAPRSIGPTCGLTGADGAAL